MSEPHGRRPDLAQAGNKHDLSDLVLEKTRHPLHRLEEVPVDQQYVSRLTVLLAQHGALLHQQYTRAYKRPGPNGEALPSCYGSYTVLFPPGTTRAYKLRLRSATPFEILFPDGFRLHGAEISPMSIWATPLTIFSLPEA